MINHGPRDWFKLFPTKKTSKNMGVLPSPSKISGYLNHLAAFFCPGKEVDARTALLSGTRGWAVNPDHYIQLTC